MRKESKFDDRITSERALLLAYQNSGEDLPTEVQSLGEALFKNPRSPDELGAYRTANRRKAVTADLDVLNEYYQVLNKEVPSFLEAGPREWLFHDPQRVRAAIVTTGGVAPGLNCVVHGIVKRHWHTYNVNEAVEGGVLGVHESFLGLSSLEHHMKPLKPSDTEAWLDKGGSILGIRRYDPELPGSEDMTDAEKRQALANNIAPQLMQSKIDILYVIGGDGSLSVAHDIAKRLNELNKKISIVGIPKTMDNDVMWVWQSFGFRSAVEKATEVINNLNWEAEATRRVCIIELFGAESGFVAANSTLASGHVDLVLVPEEFQAIKPEYYARALNDYINYLIDKVSKLGTVNENEKAHAVVVLAEGVGKILDKEGIKLGDSPIVKEHFTEQLTSYLKGRIKNKGGHDVEVFANQPRHNIRAIQANSQDQIYCERLGALAVDNALAGYTDFMISQWLTEYVLVPLELVQGQNKRIPPQGIFWKQVVSSTGQPCISNERYEGTARTADG